ncbi:hypothetical protein CDAR_530561 [Caerostris darwini]|uniref:Uncharacterized protein n=1 Tax=Caerostris darwini TaxID=1538125 RepID=A0AAV4MEE0_9ARAC|nr:hypothetical protein CDAR_530561 [Caerostris darwini]
MVPPLSGAQSLKTGSDQRCRRYSEPNGLVMKLTHHAKIRKVQNSSVTKNFTHGINSRGFDLATVLDLDDKIEGFPAVFIISNCQDSVPLAVAFRAVKEHVAVNPEVLMPHDTETFIMHGD